MAYLLPHETERGFALDYLSFLVGDEFVKVHFALLLQGAPGTGKSFLGAVAEQMIGIRNTRMVKSHELTKEFTTGKENGQVASVRTSRPTGALSLCNSSSRDTRAMGIDYGIGSGTGRDRGGPTRYATR